MEREKNEGYYGRRTLINATSEYLFKIIEILSFELPNASSMFRLFVVKGAIISFPNYSMDTLRYSIGALRLPYKFISNKKHELVFYF